MGANTVSILLRLARDARRSESGVRQTVDSVPAFSDTHPGLLEAVGPPAVVRVVRSALRLLELLPQPLYPVVVAGS